MIDGAAQFSHSDITHGGKRAKAHTTMSYGNAQLDRLTAGIEDEATIERPKFLT
jgi:hypothetical protein